MSNWDNPELLKVPLSLNIQCHAYLPAGTILVSPDIWNLIRQQYGVEERDRKFLAALGIQALSAGDGRGFGEDRGVIPE